jgi:hypothetical protein
MRRLALPMQQSIAGPNGDSTGLSGLVEMMRPPGLWIACGRPGFTSWAGGTITTWRPLGRLDRALCRSDEPDPQGGVLEEGGVGGGRRGIHARARGPPRNREARGRICHYQRQAVRQP